MYLIKHILKFNPKKSAGVKFGNENYRKNLINNLKFKFGVEIIQFKGSAKDLALIQNLHMDIKNVEKDILL